MRQFVDKFTIEEISKVKMNMVKGVLSTKVFKVDEEISELLLRTDNKVYKRKLPFNNFFIDVSISLNKHWMGDIQTGSPDFLITGIWVLSADIFDGDYTDTIQIYLPKEWISGEENYRVMHNFTLFESKKHKLYDFIRTYVCNFLDFLNNPEAELITVERTKEQNKKRILRGKNPLPPQIFVNITGKLKIYLDELKSNTDFSYNHRFDVRGHFRTLRSEKWKDSRGMKIWIPPYIKGKGIYIKKVYDVKK